MYWNNTVMSNVLYGQEHEYNSLDITSPAWKWGENIISDKY